MSLSKDEWEEIIGRFGAVVKLEINEAMKQPCQDIRDLTVTVFGANKDNGLNGDMKVIRTRLGRLERVSYIWHGAVTAALTFLGMQK